MKQWYCIQIDGLLYGYYPTPTHFEQDLSKVSFTAAWIFLPSFRCLNASTPLLEVTLRLKPIQSKMTLILVRSNHLTIRFLRCGILRGGGIGRPWGSGWSSLLPWGSGPWGLLGPWAFLLRAWWLLILFGAECGDCAFAIDIFGFMKKWKESDSKTGSLNANSSLFHCVCT